VKAEKGRIDMIRTLEVTLKKAHCFVVAEDSDTVNRVTTNLLRFESDDTLFGLLKWAVAHSLYIEIYASGRASIEDVNDDPSGMPILYEDDLLGVLQAAKEWIDGEDL